MKKILLTTVLCITLLTPTSAHAVLGGILGCGAAGATGGALSAANSVTAVPVADKITNINTEAVKQKECVLDGLTIALRQGLITAITQSIVDWINGGFEGGPSFVTNLNGFLGEIADQTSLDFIQGTELGFLCSPFELEVRLALAVQRQPFKERIRCSLGDVSDNVSGFLNGDFSRGGWPAWFDLSSRFSNTPYGAYSLAQSELNIRISGRQSEETQLLSFGGGFFSKRECIRYESVTASKISNDGASQERCAQWEIVTPGAQINDSLSQALGSGFRQLELADEIDEIINALIAQLSQKALTSLDGLRGLSSRSSSSSGTYIRTTQTTAVDEFGNTVVIDRNESVPGSYLDIIVNQTQVEATNAGRTALVNEIETALDLEDEYQDILADLINGLENASDEVARLYQCYINITLDPAGTTGISSTNALAQAGVASSTIQNNFAPQIARYRAELSVSIETTQKLAVVLSEAKRARSADELNAAADRYDAILASGIIHSASEVAFLENDLNVQTVALEALEDDTDAAVRECRRL